jgi:hypothetical protein
MAPEQARGEAVDARADVFAFGSILAAILTGQPAFIGKSGLETIQKAAKADLADVWSHLNACERMRSCSTSPGGVCSQNGRIDRPMLGWWRPR